MAEAESESEQCRALTTDGERCTRPAQDDDFCYQHDKNDPTIDDDQSDDTTAEATDDEQTNSPEDEMSDGDESDGEDAENDGAESDGDGSENGEVGLIEIRNTVRSNAAQLIGHPFDALVEVERRTAGDGDGEREGWIAVVEVVERKSVPDTQDILGRYEIDLDGSGQFEAYRRIQRLHRGDTGESEL